VNISSYNINTLYVILVLITQNGLVDIEVNIPATKELIALVDYNLDFNNSYQKKYVP